MRRQLVGLASGELAARPALAGILAAPLLTSPRQQDFESFWYFTILGIGLVVLVGGAAVYAFRSVRPMWREGQREVAVIVSAAVGFVCLFVLSLILIALIGLTNHATTPGTAPASIGG